MSNELWNSSVDFSSQGERYGGFGACIMRILSLTRSAMELLYSEVSNSP